jgi:hypothetical protein
VVRWTTALAASALVACFDPSYRAGAVCSELDTCPPGQTCSNGLCALPGGPGPADAADVVDGPVIDATDVDASDIDASGIDAAIVDATVDAVVDATVDASGPPPFCGQLVDVLTADSPDVVSSEPFDMTGEYAGWHAFDAALNTLWISKQNATPAIIGYVWPGEPRRAVRYAIHFTNNISQRGPRDWTLQGFDGAAWVPITQVTGSIDWLGVERREFTVPGTTAYRGYRLVITEDNYDGTGIVVVSMGRLELIGPDCP